MQVNWLPTLTGAIGAGIVAATQSGLVSPSNKYVGWGIVGLIVAQAFQKPAATPTAPPAPVTPPAETK